MSKRAEEAALKAYPILFSERNHYDNTFKDRRESYIKGYERAEKYTIERAIKWLNENWREYVWTTDNGIPHFGHWKSDFIKAMENEDMSHELPRFI